MSGRLQRQVPGRGTSRSACPDRRSRSHCIDTRFPTGNGHYEVTTKQASISVMPTGPSGLSRDRSWAGSKLDPLTPPRPFKLRGGRFRGRYVAVGCNLYLTPGARVRGIRGMYDSPAAEDKEAPGAGAASASGTRAPWIPLVGDMIRSFTTGLEVTDSRRRGLEGFTTREKWDLPSCC